jgi:uncharacterized protein (DUF2249 family)
MISKDIKISRLLKEYPQSLDILLRTSPHFNKLQNKLLRKTLAGRVTVEQAASIANVDLNSLLLELNNSVDNHESNGFEIDKNDNLENTCNMVIEKPAIPSGKPEYLNSLPSDKMSFLDVRPILDSGKDPLNDILAKTKELKTGEALLITNSFEPIPLYTLLGKKGFLHFTEKENNTYKVYFYKRNAEKAISQNPVKVLTVNSDVNLNENDFENIIELDVHELQPPEPMMKILENLDRIDEKSIMLVYHHREPHLLYPKLEERGYQVICNKLGEDNYKILITKK